MIYILYLPDCGANLTCSINERISSTELLEAASNSEILKELLELNERHDGQTSQASMSGVGLSQLMVFAKILAQVVFPTPRGPQNKNECAK